MSHVTCHMTKQTAKLNYLRIAPRKVRLVADLIKGLPVAEAEAQLLGMRNRAAVPLLKLLRSAKANVKNNKRLSEEHFFIERLTVDGGPMLKRYLPRARGSASPLQKKMSNVTLVLAENPNLKPSRFTIIIEKKTKLPPELSGPAKRGKPKPEKKDEEGKPKKQRFYQRLFNRKAGFAK